MPTNALAPTPVNRLLDKPAQLPAEWSKILAPNSAAYETAILLHATGQLPKISFTKLSEKGRSGEYDRESNSISINPSSKDLSTTLAHELTHALRHAMESKVRGIGATAEQTGVPPTGIDKQLFDAWYKLDPDTTKLKPLNYPDAKYQDYRFSFSEAPAFAVGRMDNPQKNLSREQYYMTNPGGSHYDATLATEQALLRALYAKQSNIKLK